MSEPTAETPASPEVASVPPQEPQAPASQTAAAIERGDADVLARLYEGDRFVPRALLVPQLPDEPEILREWLEQKRGGRVELHVPQRGERKKHLALAMQNAELGDAVEVDALDRLGSGRRGDEPR